MQGPAIALALQLPQMRVAEMRQPFLVALAGAQAIASAALRCLGSREDNGGFGGPNLHAELRLFVDQALSRKSV